MTKYEDIYKQFLFDLEDPVLSTYPPEDLEYVVNTYMKKALAKIAAKHSTLINDFKERDDDEGCFLSDLDEMEIEILVLYMKVVWYDSKISSIPNTVFVVSSKDTRTMEDPRRHTQSLREQREAIRLEAVKMVRDYHYRNNNYLNNK